MTPSKNNLGIYASSSADSSFSSSSVSAFFFLAAASFFSAARCFFLEPFGGRPGPRLAGALPFVVSFLAAGGATAARFLG